MERPLMLLLDTNILIDVLQGEAVALAWLEQQQRPHISVITWIEVVVGCREGETSRVHDWLESFPRLPLDEAISAETVQLRQWHGLKTPDAIILAMARWHGFSFVTRNERDSPLALGGVLHPYRLKVPR
jgi:predicted nucleic acid-binding protein